MMLVAAFWGVRDLISSFLLSFTGKNASERKNTRWQNAEVPDSEQMLSLSNWPT
jgi:hypothetical protein